MMNYYYTTKKGFALVVFKSFQGYVLSFEVESLSYIWFYVIFIQIRKVDAKYHTQHKFCKGVFFDQKKHGQ